ncbi:hypothetical protein [Streptomyces sp. NPDC003006]
MTKQTVDQGGHLAHVTGRVQRGADVIQQHNDDVTVIGCNQRGFRSWVRPRPTLPLVAVVSLHATT